MPINMSLMDTSGLILYYQMKTEKRKCQSSLKGLSEMMVRIVLYQTLILYSTHIIN